MLGGCFAYAQETRTEIFVNFRPYSTTIDTAYADNAARKTEIISFLQQIQQDSTVSLVEVAFCGAASPEGSYQLNRRLAKGRLTALETLVRKEVEIPDSLITRNDSYIPWDYLKTQIEQSDLPHKEEVLAIIASPSHLVDYHHVGKHIDGRIKKLQRLDQGRVWAQLNRRYFSQMRNAYVVFITYKQIPPAPAPEPEPAPVVVPEPEPVVEPAPAPEPVAPVEQWTRHLYVKTNAIGWGLAITNIGVEVDLAKHWSFAVPVYYSAHNYFTSTVKFRTLTVQPEVRYWLHEDNQGFFAGAHFGYAQYNLAVNGTKRYQDHDGKSPALGGGLSVGYRMPISKSNRWHLEFTLGAGVYALHYDTFYNVKNGKEATTTRKTYWGLDNAAINFSYRFNLNKRK